MKRTARPRTPALRPVEPESGVLVHTHADRQLATEHWLLSTHPAPEKARREWSEPGKVALLPLGTLFSAVRLPGRLVLAVAGTPVPADVDGFLDEVLDGGPVICDMYQHRYYALVPGSMPERWRQAADDWRPLGVDCLGRGTYLGVPKLDAVEHNPRAYASYWSVPMPSAAVLCTPLNVARLIAAGKRALEGALERP
ncbi:hypothetical protein [Streptomyces sp. S.PB5]|uniref:hypothetical protein n=1 Tax=Streptomyces sp. S.PB5 TaxID=3020844 RepID=UPI0025B00248|nr:hypothetical protein [Streptomyces sp. S.PB5]MDN3023825.1 hypothetical protein [Streptomyces sp. S.PB5]